jgi:hypothetical protein
MGVVSQKLRDSARGQPCMFRIPMCCNHDPETTVFCHAPDESKGVGNKTHDFLGAFGCSDCHAFMDNRRGASMNLDRYWLDAMRRQLTWWVEQGFIVIPETQTRAKPLTKVYPRPEHFHR